MFSTQNTPLDPRERLVAVGNELLDALFDLDATENQWKQLNDAKDDPTALAALMADGGIQVLVGRLGIVGRRDQALREYVTIRRTIEALAPVSNDHTGL